MRLYCWPRTTQEKPKLLSSTTTPSIRNSSVGCSKAILLNIQKSEVCTQISVPKSSNRGQLSSCEDIISAAWPDTWQQSHTMERKLLCTSLMKLTELWNLNYSNQNLRTKVHKNDPTKFWNICFSKKKAQHNFCLFRFKVSIHKVFHQQPLHTMVLLYVVKSQQHI